MAAVQRIPRADIVIDVCVDREDEARALGEIRAGLLLPLPETNPKYFYDDLGSALFEAICELPEYYQTRTERALLERIAPHVVATTGAAELVELGAGAALKTRVLLDAMAEAGTLRRFVPFDVSEGIVRRVATELVREYPGLAVHGVVADFMEQMAAIPNGTGDPRLVLFLGGTIGNFRPAAAREFLRRLAARMRPGDFLMLGTDLVKDTGRLEAAYNDTRGVTADFNRNVLRVLNSMLGANFDLGAFEHRAFFDRDRRWIEMRLVAKREHRVAIPRLDLDMYFQSGDEIRTEISAKYDRGAVEHLLGASGFRLAQWHTDAENLFAVSLAQRA